MDTAALGSSSTILHQDDSGLESLQISVGIQRLRTAPSDNTKSFTSLLELPPTQAMELHHSQDSDVAAKIAIIPGNPIQHQIYELKPYPFPNFTGNLTFPTNAALIERAAKCSVFAGGSSPITEAASSAPSNSSMNLDKVKNEPTETDSNPTLSQLLGGDTTLENKKNRPVKRKERVKKVRGSTKKNKRVADESSRDGEKLPYVHVRARRGQATGSHSLAERARREKINARMKFLQELVPGCHKISGTALVLDEIINHVQSLQRQVEFLSMKLAAINPRIDFNLESLLATDGPLLVDGNFANMVPPAAWPDMSVSGTRQQCRPHWHFDPFYQPLWGKEEENRNFTTPENSLLSYDSSAISASLHSNQMKMEL